MGLETQWKVYSNIRRNWIILMNLCYFQYKIEFLRSLQFHKYLIVLCEQLRWTSKHRPIKFNTFLGFTHMDHYIGCHTCAFTVAYIILWLEVLLHYSTVKVFHIRCATRGGGSPTLFWKSKKCRNFGKKLLILSILKLNLPLKI